MSGRRGGWEEKERTELQGFRWIGPRVIDGGKEIEYDGLRVIETLVEYRERRTFSQEIYRLTDDTRTHRRRM